MNEVIKLSKQMHLNYIESEILNYYYHFGLMQKYQNKIDQLKLEYERKLLDPPVAGGIIKMPSGNSANSNWIINMCGEIGYYEEKRDLEHKHIERVNKWLNQIPFEEKHKIIIEQFMKKGIDAAIVAENVKYSEVAVYKVKERVLDKIYSRFFKSV